MTFTFYFKVKYEYSVGLVSYRRLQMLKCCVRVSFVRPSNGL